MITKAMRALPLGFPKIMVSTMAAGNVGDYIGTSDLIMAPTVSDLAGNGVVFFVTADGQAV